MSDATSVTGSPQQRSHALGQRVVPALGTFLHRGQESVHALVTAGEGVAQGDRRGPAVVQLETHPVRRQVPAQVLGTADRGATQVGPA